MRQTTRLRQLLQDDTIVRLIGAHSPLSAKIGEETGFDAIWASGLEVSALAGVPDANILSLAESALAASNMANAVEIPVLADCDSGFGNVNNVADMVRRYETGGVAGVCIEDKQYPKLNSFAGAQQDLTSTEDFVSKIIAATQSRQDPDLVVVARLEALIAGAGMEEALERAFAYEAAGADALLIHSKRTTPDEIYEFRQRYKGKVPVIVVPTTYNHVTASELEAHGFGAVIYANHALRSSISAMQSVLRRIHSDGTTRHIEAEIAPVKRVFELQKMSEMLEDQRRFEADAGVLLEGLRPQVVPS